MKRVLVVFVLFLSGVIFASDPPDTMSNPITGDLETVDSYIDGSNYEVRHTITPSSGPTTSVKLSNTNLDDESPRIFITSTGKTFVVWHEDNGDALVRSRDSNGVWSSLETLNDVNETASSPEITGDHTGEVWTVFEESPSTQIIVRAIADGPDPIDWLRFEIGSSSYIGDLDSQIHHNALSLWVTWIDSNSDVAWSEYDYISETWSSVSFEDYSADSVQEARDRIETMVLN